MSSSRLKSLSIAIAIAAVILSGLLGCGADPEEEFVPKRGGAAISELDVDGHSLAFGSVAQRDGPNGTGAASQVAQALDLEENNAAVVGATLQESGIKTDGWGKVLRSFPRPPAGRDLKALSRMALLWYGANDVALFGSDLSLAEHAYRTIISRHRSSAVYEAGASPDSSITASDGWTPTGAAPGEASGGSVLTSNRSGRLKIRIDRGSLPDGATVALGFVQAENSSADYAIEVDGKPEGTLSTRGPARPGPGAYVPETSASAFVFRIEDLSSEEHTIEVVADNVDRGTSFDYWQVEPPAPEPIVLVKQYLLPPVDEQEIAGNDDYAALNRMTDSLANEFGKRVIAVDTDRAIKRSRRLISSDGLHLNQQGHDLVAHAILAAIKRSPFADELDPPG